jgi:hypothetical protein
MPFASFRVNERFRPGLILTRAAPAQEWGLWRLRRFRPCYANKQPLQTKLKQP